MSATVWQFEHSLALPFFGIGMKTDLFQSQTGWQYTALTYSFPYLEPVCSRTSSNLFDSLSPPGVPPQNGSSELSRVLWVRQDRNQFLQQLPDEPEGWTHSPLLCLHPKGGGSDWGIPSQLLCTMPRRRRGAHRHTKCREPSCACAEVSSWFSSGWGAVASQVVGSSHSGVLLRLLLIWCIRGRKKACCFLVCYHANIILLAFVFEEFFFFWIEE